VDDQLRHNRWMLYQVSILWITNSA
jgi:hypothetical protein